MVQGCVMMCAMVSMFRAQVGMKVFLPPSTMQVLGMEFRSSGSIALTHSSNLSGPLDFTRNSNGSFLPLSSSLDLKNAI